jgi:transposase
MSIPGVGEIAALTFKAAVDDLTRRRSELGRQEQKL